jgi:Neuraminidase (sialidase)
MKFDKKRVGAWLACGAVVATLGTIGAASVSAASPFTMLQVKTENGVKRYSTDDGKTWSTEAPDGVTERTNADGRMTITRGIAPTDGNGPTETSGQTSLLVKVEDGVQQYSTDGGKTWSKQLPK